MSGARAAPSGAWDVDPKRPTALLRRARAALYASPAWRLALGGRAPAGLAFFPPDPWPGNAAAGDSLFQGRYRFAGHEEFSAAAPAWTPAEADDAWIAEMHAFEWLRHFRASGGEAARRHARAVVADWIRRCGRWRADIWDAATTGRRVASWTSCAGFLLKGADPRWREAFLASLDFQARHLAHAARGETAGARRIAALRGILRAELCLGRREGRIRATLARLARECREQVGADGGHRERSPAIHLAALADLIDCRDVLRAADREPPAELCETIERMAPALRALCHGDGGLAAFNGSGEYAFPGAAAVLKAAGCEARPPADARHAGFQRLAAGRSTVIVDAAAAAGAPSDHASAAAFEMSVGGRRLVVNCGPHGGRGPAWAEALRGPAAHSTLVLADGEGDIDAAVDSETHAADGALWLDVTRATWARRFGFSHRRRFYLAADGAELRGEDILSPVAGTAEPQPFAVRFHLHPAVAAAEARQGRAAALRLADGAEWRLDASGGSLAVNASVYFADDFTHRACRQAVIAGVCPAEGTLVRWSLRRV